MKYRDLIKKYMRNVSEAEGTLFVDYRNTWLTAEEYAALRRLAKEFMEEHPGIAHCDEAE